MPGMSLSRYCSVKEAAAMLGMSPASVRRLLARDRIDAKKVGTTWLVLKSSVREYPDVKRPAGRPAVRL